MPDNHDPSPAPRTPKPMEADTAPNQDRRLTVTVVTCTLNAEQHLQRCIDSVKSQTYPLIRHLIVDGLSKDRTVEIAMASGADVVSEKDQGVYDAFAKGVHLAQGDIIAILGADDYFASSEVVARAVGLMESASADVAYAQVDHVDEEGQLIRRVGRRLGGRNDLLKKMAIAHPSLFVRKTVYDRFGSFHQCFKIAGDYDFCLRIWDKVRSVYAAEPWVIFTIGGTSTVNPERSYRESMAVQLLHGVRPFPALLSYFAGRLRHWLVYRDKPMPTCSRIRR